MEVSKAQGIKGPTKIDPAATLGKQQAQCFGRTLPNLLQDADVILHQRGFDNEINRSLFCTARLSYIFMLKTIS